MRKYILRYLIFWLPAVLVAYLYADRTLASQAVQWFCAFFMILGWGVNTGMGAYYYPRSTLSLLLGWLGVNILIIMALYNVTYAPGLHEFLFTWGGIFSFKPMEILIMALIDFNIQHELVVTGVLAGICALGWLVGIICRKIRPNPYRPKMYKMAD